MEEERRLVAHPGACLVVLLGAIGFVGASLLPYYDAGSNIPATMSDPSFFNLVTFFRASSLAGAGGVLSLFAGMARITGITLVCLFSYRSWVPAALLAVSIAWSLAWIGTFLGGTEIFAPHAIGYWAMIVSVGVVLAGAIAVWRSARTGLSEQQQQPTV